MTQWKGGGGDLVFIIWAEQGGGGLFANTFDLCEFDAAMVSFRGPYFILGNGNFKQQKMSEIPCK